MKHVVLVLLLLSIFSMISSKKIVKGDKLMYVPLDERYATRGMFLNMARITGKWKSVLTPSSDLLPRRKISASPVSYTHLTLPTNAADE